MCKECLLLSHSQPYFYACHQDLSHSEFIRETWMNRITFISECLRFMWLNHWNFEVKCAQLVLVCGENFRSYKPLRQVNMLMKKNLLLQTFQPLSNRFNHFVFFDRYDYFDRWTITFFSTIYMTHLLLISKYQKHIPLLLSST